MDKFIIPIIIVAIIAFFYFRSNMNNKDAEQNSRLGAEYLANNKALEGVVETESGL